MGSSIGVKPPAPAQTSSNMRSPDKASVELTKAIIDSQSVMFDKAAAYNNIVTTLGYAGFFAVWQTIRSEMKPWDNTLIAILLGVSLLLFVGWNILTMVVNSKRSIKIGRALSSSEDPDVLLIRYRQAEADANVITLRYYANWQWIFMLALFTGFLAGLLLLSLLFGSLVGQPFSFYDIINEQA